MYVDFTLADATRQMTAPMSTSIYVGSNPPVSYTHLMSDVYKAKDLTLGRFVAIKVLKPEFSEDLNFVTKFRTEAQSAAGLDVYKRQGRYGSVVFGRSDQYGR